MIARIHAFVETSCVATTVANAAFEFSCTAAANPSKLVVAELVLETAADSFETDRLNPKFQDLGLDAVSVILGSCEFVSFIIKSLKTHVPALCSVDPLSFPTF